MRKPLWCLAAWLLALSSLRAADPFLGAWIGGFEQNGSWVFVQTRFGPITKGHFGIIDMIEFPRREREPLVVLGRQMDNVKLEDSQAHFEITAGTNKYSFDGTLTNGVLTGKAAAGGREYPFRLGIMAPVQAARFASIYQVGPGHYITLERSSGVNALISVDSLTGQSRMFVPRSDNTFTCGPEVMKAWPVETTIHFTTNSAGQCTGMEWKPEKGDTLTGKPGKFHDDGLAFTNGKVALAGTLVLPPSEGPHPAIVLVTESGSGQGKDLRPMADFFALNGVAALVYDQRGNGASKGNWRASGFDDSAGDALAAVEALRGRKDINPGAVGLWSMGPGGWIAGLAASRSTNVAFVISLSGSGLTPEDQWIYAIEQRMKVAGFSDDDLAEALALYRQDSLCAKTGTNWDDYETAVKMAQKKPWFGRDLTPYDRKNQGQWRLVWNYDPVPALEKVTCPVLALYGELDNRMPAKKSADLWETALKKAGNRDVTIKTLPETDHGLLDVRNGVPAPDFYSLQRDWLLKRFKPAP